MGNKKSLGNSINTPRYKTVCCHVSPSSPTNSSSHYNTLSDALLPCDICSPSSSHSTSQSASYSQSTSQSTPSNQSVSQQHLSQHHPVRQHLSQHHLDKDYTTCVLNAQRNISQQSGSHATDGDVDDQIMV